VGDSSSAPRVPCLWPGSTIVVIGSGPSLSDIDIEACRIWRLQEFGSRVVIAISDVYTLAPWTDVLYAPDERWWDWHQDAVTRPARKYSLQQTKFASVTRLAPGRQTVIETDPRFLSTGGHGGWQAINLAVHLGAARIVLLGFDMCATDDGRHHFFGEHPNNTHVRYAQWLPLYDDLPHQLSAHGITIVNATRSTAIRGIPRVDLPICLNLLSPSATPSKAK